MLNSKEWKIEFISISDDADIGEKLYKLSLG